LNRASSGTVSFEYSTLNGSAEAGTDYTDTAGAITIVGGHTSTTVDVPVIGDGVAEGNETFRLRLLNVQGAGLAGEGGTGTIVNDDQEPTRITLRARGSQQHIVARGRILHAEPGMQVRVVLLKKLGHSYVRIARDIVSIHIGSRGGAHPGIFVARFTHQSHGRYVIRAIFRGDAMHLPARAHAHVRL
jgi:hypothetical protein